MRNEARCLAAARQTTENDRLSHGAYLKDITGEDFTAKDFRTWAGTVQTALALAAIGTFESATEAKRNIVAAIKDTAARLGNRPATCRTYYVHPAVIESYLEGNLPDMVRPRPG